MPSKIRDHQTLYPLPAIIDPPERKQICICIPDEPSHRQAFFGAIYNLTRWYSWGRDDAQTGKAVADVWLNIYDCMMENIKMGDCGCGGSGETTVIEHRVNPETGRLEISTDGGETWQPDPADIINTIPQLPPPVPAGVSATRCDAATNGFDAIKSIISNDSESFTTASALVPFALLVCLFIVTLVFAPEGTPAIVPIIIAAAGAVFSAGKAAFDAYWTDDEKDKILCILFCNIQADGSFSDSGYASVIADLTTQLTGGAPKEMLISEIKAMGRPGLNNLCAYGVSADADCSDCPCASCPELWRLSYPEDSRFGRFISLNVEEGWVQFGTDTINIDGHYYIDIRTPSDSQCCCVTDITAVGGGVDTAWQLCGEPFSGGSFHTGDGRNTCDHHLQMKGGGDPYTVKVFLTDCPCE